MEQQKAISVNIINRNYPPYTGITGASAAELAAYLLNSKCSVNIIHVDANYVDSNNKEEPIGNVYRIKTFYNGKNVILRLISNLYEGFLLIRKSISIPSNLTICLTDPPLLSMWASLLLKKTKWILWAMDLYPEAFVADNLVSSKNILYQIIDRILLKNKPNHIIALGEYQAKYLAGKYGKEIGFTILPVGVYNVPMDEKNTPVPDWASDRSKIYLGYCGNLGEAHSVEFLIAVINYLDLQKCKLILAIYGSRAQRVIDFAKGKPGVQILPFVNRTDLKFIDIHLASLATRWVNVCVPSKTVSSVCSGSAFLYNGSKESDNWEMLKSAGWIVEDTDLVNQVKKFFNQLNQETLNEKKMASAQLSKLLNEQKARAFNDIYQEIKSTIVNINDSRS